MSVSPRVNGALLVQFINKPVRLVGTVVAYDQSGQQMQMRASDNTLVTVLVAMENVGVTWEAGQIIEVIGAVQGNAQPTIQEYTSIPFSKGFDLSQYDRLVQLIHSQPKLAELFGH